MKKIKKEPEVFLTIRNFPDYKISNFGRVFSKKRNTFINGRPNTQGYYQVGLRDVNCENIVWVLIHRLVAEYFIPNLGGYNQIDHIDENKSNNFVGNLRWVTPKENINHGSHNQRVVESNKRNRDFNICQYDLEGNLVKEYNSVSEAALAVGGRTDSIRWALDGKLKTSYGFVWRRIPKYTQDKMS
jgi:hypothetical protein